MAIDPARQALLEELTRAALATYGEERCGEFLFKTGLETAATALWRISREALEPLGPEPLPTHD
jgi:hypothetical protein